MPDISYYCTEVIGLWAGRLAALACCRRSTELCCCLRRRRHLSPRTPGRRTRTAARRLRIPAAPALQCRMGAAAATAPQPAAAHSLCSCSFASQSSATEACSSCCCPALRPGSVHRGRLRRRRIRTPTRHSPGSPGPHSPNPAGSSSYRCHFCKSAAPPSHVELQPPAGCHPSQQINDSVSRATARLGEPGSRAARKAAREALQQIRPFSTPWPQREWATVAAAGHAHVRTICCTLHSPSAIAWVCTTQLPQWDSRGISSSLTRP